MPDSHLPHNDEHIEAWLCSTFYVLDENHVPRKARSIQECDKALGTPVDKTQVGKKLVSTAFLGIDHNYIPGGKPVLFETAIVDQDHGCDVVERYETWDEAKEGHQRHVKQLRNKRGK